MYMKMKRDHFLNSFDVSKVEEIELNDNEENYA